MVCIDSFIEDEMNQFEFMNFQLQINFMKITDTQQIDKIFQILPTHNNNHCIQFDCFILFISSFEKGRKLFICYIWLQTFTFAVWDYFRNAFEGRKCKYTTRVYYKF